MKFRGLKLTIAGDFSLLLCIGMLLVNFVLISLWRHYMASYTIEQAKTSLSFLEMTVRGNCDELSNRLDTFNRSQDKGEKELFLYQKKRLLPQSNSKVIDKITSHLALSAYSQTEIIQSFGSIQSIFGFGTRDILVARPLKKCSGGSLGLFVHMQSVHEAIMSKQPYVLVYILVNVIILTTLGFFRLRKSVVRPLEKLVKISDSYTGSEGELLDFETSRNEFGHVASSLQAMLHRIEKDKEKLKATIGSLEEANKKLLENQKTLVEAEKLSAVGRLSAGFAHEIGNPLGIIQGYVELLGREDVTEEERVQYTERAVKELERVTGLIHQLLNLARKQENEKSETDVHELIAELVEMLKQQNSARNINIVFHQGAPALLAQCGETDLHQVLLNCLLNGIDAIAEKEPESGEINISACLQNDKDKDVVLIEIEDNGSGINQKDMAMIFDPFFTTKDVGHGTGLGLAVSRSIIENNNGTLEIQSQRNSGTKVIIRLLAADPQLSKKV